MESEHDRKVYELCNLGQSPVRVFPEKFTWSYRARLEGSFRGPCAARGELLAPDKRAACQEAWVMAVEALRPQDGEAVRMEFVRQERVHHG